MLALLDQLVRRNYLAIGNIDTLAVERCLRFFLQLSLGSPDRRHVLEVHVLRLVELPLVLIALVKEQLLGASRLQDQLLLLDGFGRERGVLLQDYRFLAVLQVGRHY